MDDIHTLRKPASRIPILSPFLHFVSMTVVVHLRRSFGFDYLGEKRWFIIPSWAFVLFFIMAWNTPLLWQLSPPFWCFGLATVIVYLFHLLVAFRREPTASREHSKFSGRPHFLGLCRKLATDSWPAERLCLLVIEPAVVFVVALIVRLFFSDALLSLWLAFAAACLFLAEFYNYWFVEVRAPNIGDEVQDKAREDTERLGAKEQQTEVKKTRTDEAAPRRNARPVEEELKDDKFGAVLGMRRPYKLEAAEARFKALMLTDHSDKHQMSAESHERSIELNEAIEYFRKNLRG
jgi:hypothetical protein